MICNNQRGRRPITHLSSITLLLVCLISCEKQPPDYLGDLDGRRRDATVIVDPLNIPDQSSAMDLMPLDMGMRTDRGLPIQDQAISEQLDQTSLPPSCASVCDCAEGQGCIEGYCVEVAQPSYCCSQGECPSGNFCERQDGSLALCASIDCLSACDCPRGQACVDGICELSEEQGLTYCCEDPACPFGRECELPTGDLSTCRGEAECTVICDCQDLPGTTCLGGRCVPPPPDEPIIVCCETDCINGLTCEWPNGSREICP